MLSSLPSTKYIILNIGLHSFDLSGNFCRSYKMIWFESIRFSDWCHRIWRWYMWSKHSCQTAYFWRARHRGKCCDMKPALWLQTSPFSQYISKQLCSTDHLEICICLSRYRWSKLNHQIPINVVTETLSAVEWLRPLLRLHTFGEIWSPPTDNCLQGASKYQYTLIYGYCFLCLWCLVPPKELLRESRNLSQYNLQYFCRQFLR